MSTVGTQPTESATMRNNLKKPSNRRGRVTRAESILPETLLEYKGREGGLRKWCSLYYGGEFRAG